MDNMKIGLVPDPHGREFWHDIESKVNDLDLIIFLGDYLDPYPHEGITVEKAIEEFKLILEFKDKNPNKVILLTGNHDWGYINKEFPDPSRRSYSHYGEIHQLFMSNINKFQLIYRIDNYLFSHAGVYEDWLKCCEFTLEDLEDFNRFIDKDWPALTCTSFLRGGWGHFGSCIWADIREYKNEKPKGYKQIVGHTQLEKGAFIEDDISCIDCRHCFILNTKANTLEQL